MPSSADDGSIKPVGGPKAPASVDGVEKADAVATTEAAAPANPNAAIAEALRAGQITPAEAQAQLIDEVVRQQLGPDASEALVEELKAALLDMFEVDPAMAALLKP